MNTSFNASALPTSAAVRSLLDIAGITVPITVDDQFIYNEIQSVASDFNHRTGRQFVPGCAGEIRYYDGSATGLLVIDEYIEVTAVEVLVVLPLGSTYNALNFYQVLQNGRPNTQLAIAQGPPNYPGIWSSFPSGRRNIKVTGQFGYAATLPAEVYQAILKMAAGKIADTLTMSSKSDAIIGGRVVSWTEADVTEKYADVLPSQALGWAQEYEGAVVDHMKPRKKRSRRLY